MVQGAALSSCLCLPRSCLSFPTAPTGQDSLVNYNLQTSPLKTIPGACFLLPAQQGMGSAGCLQGWDKVGQPVPWGLHTDEDTWSIPIYLSPRGSAAGSPQEEPPHRHVPAPSNHGGPWGHPHLSSA